MRPFFLVLIFCVFLQKICTLFASAASAKFAIIRKSGLHDGDDSCILYLFVGNGVYQMTEVERTISWMRQSASELYARADELEKALKLGMDQDDRILALEEEVDELEANCERLIAAVSDIEGTCLMVDDLVRR